MVGLVKFSDGGSVPRPVYKEYPVDEPRDIEFRRLLMFLIFGLSCSAPLVILYYLIDYRSNVNEIVPCSYTILSKFLGMLFLFMLYSLFPIGYLAYLVFDECFIYQKVICKVPKSDTFYRVLDVKIIFRGAERLVDERTQIDQQILLTWFSIAPDGDFQLAIRISTGEIIHSFTKTSEKIQLLPGDYNIRILNIEFDGPSIEPTMKEPESKQCDQLLPEREELSEKKHSMMIID